MVPVDCFCFGFLAKMNAVAAGQRVGLSLEAIFKHAI